jgi:hypothetical protein
MSNIAEENAQACPSPNIRKVKGDKPVVKKKKKKVLTKK